MAARTISADDARRDYVWPLVDSLPEAARKAFRLYFFQSGAERPPLLRLTSPGRVSGEVERTMLFAAEGLTERDEQLIRAIRETELDGDDRVVRNTANAIEAFAKSPRSGHPIAMWARLIQVFRLRGQHPTAKIKIPNTATWDLFAFSLDRLAQAAPEIEAACAGAWKSVGARTREARTGRAVALADFAKETIDLDAWSRAWGLDRHSASRVTPPDAKPPPAVTRPPGPQPKAGNGPKRAGIWPLPGGVRAYAKTLLALLEDIDARAPLPIADLEQLFEQRYQATGVTALRGYRFILRSTRFVEETDDLASLTDAGRAWLHSPQPSALFDRLHAEFTGMMEALVLAEVAPTLTTARAHAVLCMALGVSWQTDTQVTFRRNWLLSLGLTDRSRAGDSITAAGSAVLGTHATEASGVRERLLAALAAPTPDVIIETPADEELDDIAPGIAAALPDSPLTAGWLSAQLDLSGETIAAHLGPLRLDAHVVDQLAAAVSSGKHILFVGPPGTGKTELAVALARAAQAEGYCSGVFTATASADWTTFDTIGGYAMQKDQTLAFRPGAFLRAIQEQKWLLVDELNRADVDRAFGELMTVLAGQGTDTHYELAEGKRVSIGSEEHRTFRVPPSFRVLATMNVWDKTSLFRLSYAVQRRFAIINVGAPPDAVYAAVLAASATEGALLPPLTPAHLPSVVRLFSQAGLLSLREVGPAIALDVIRYLRRRGAHPDGIAEAIEMFVLPQLQGIEDGAAKDARGHCDDALGMTASTRARASLRARFRELFPGLGAADD